MIHQFARFTHRFGEFGVKLLMGMKRLRRHKKRFTDLEHQKRMRKVRENQDNRAKAISERYKVTNPLLAKIIGIPVGLDRYELDKKREAR